MTAAAELCSDVVGVGSYVKSFAATNGEIDFWQFDAVDFISMNTDGAGLSFDFFALACHFVEGYAADFDGGYHGGDLLEVAKVGGECGVDLLFGVGGDFRFVDDLSFFVLG